MTITGIYDSVSNCNVYGKHTRHTEVQNGKIVSIIEFKNGMTVKVGRQKERCTIKANNNTTRPTLKCKKLNNPLITGSECSDFIKLYDCNRPVIDVLNDSTVADQVYVYSKKRCQGPILNAGGGDQIQVKMIGEFGEIINATIDTRKK